MSAILRVDGAVVFWTLGDWTSRDSIENGWRGVMPAHGVNDWAAMAPKPRTPNACLRDALVVQFPKSLIRPLEKRNGFAILEEKRYRDEVVTATTHAVRIDDLGRVDIMRGWTHDLEVSLTEEFKRQSGLLKPSQVAGSLVNVLTHMNRVCLRPTGGVYWLSDEYLHTWGALTHVVESASVGGRNTVYRITHQFDAHSIRAVRDALLGEVDKEAHRIMEEVDSGEFGEDGLITRARLAEQLQDKVREYERILGERLPDAAEIAKKAELTATAAKIMAVGAA